MISLGRRPYHGMISAGRHLLSAAKIVAAMKLFASLKQSGVLEGLEWQMSKGNAMRLINFTKVRTVLANINGNVLPAARCRWRIQLSATSATKSFWKDVRRREGTIGHGMAPLGFEVAAR